MACSWQSASHHLAASSAAAVRRLAMNPSATLYRVPRCKILPFRSLSTSLPSLASSSQSSFQRGTISLAPRAIPCHVDTWQPSTSIKSITTASANNGSSGGGSGSGSGSGTGGGTNSSNTPVSRSVSGRPAVPLLIFSPTGQLSLTTQRPPVDSASAPPPPSPPASPVSSLKSSASSTKSSASSGSSSSSASASSRPRTREKPAGPTSAPRYSKAARRFFNERFRSAEREAAQRGQRLSKVLAAAGIASRRACEDIIFAGRVTVNGNTCTVPQTAVDPMKDSIYVDGKSLPRKAPPRLYFMVNKPKGYICSNAPQQEVSSSRSFSPQSPKPSGRERSSGGKSRPERVEGSGFRDESSDSSSGGSGGGGGGIEKTAISLVEEYLKVWEKRNPGIPRPRLFTVGRLDVQTTGLLLVTNDGNFAQQIAHPSAGLTKEYVLTVQGPVTKRQLATMAAGTDVDGVLCTPVALDLVTDSDNKGGGGSGGKGRERVRVVVAEGRNREVRRLAEAAGLEVLGLKRVRIGSLRLPRDLGVGKYKALKSIDVERLLKEKM